MKNKLLQLGAVAIFALAAVTAHAQSWSLTGNSGTVANTNFIGTKDNKNLVFRSKNLERMRITKAGNIGIGTTVPAGKLNVDGGYGVSLTSPGYVVIGNTGSTNMGLDGSFIQARFNGTASGLYLNFDGGTTYIGNNSTSDYGVYAGGNTVGVYGNSPNIGTYGSSVNFAGLYGWAEIDGGNNSRGVVGYGNYGIYGTTRDNAHYYAGFFEGDVYSTGVYLGSDQKLKQNIKDFTSAMEIINQLHPKQYEFRHDGNYKLMNLPGGEHYGLIAQDVEKLLPSLVKNTKFDAGKALPFKPADSKNHSEQKSSATINFKALNYTEFIPIIIKGMQEINENLQQQIQEQQHRIEKLEKAIEKLSGNPNTSSIKLSSSENSGAYLKQNAPNPFTQNTIIYCYVPSSAKLAQLMIYNDIGSAVKSFDLINGINNLTISAGSLSSGEYVYSLLIDGKKIDTKKMILTK